MGADLVSKQRPAFRLNSSRKLANGNDFPVGSKQVLAVLRFVRMRSGISGSKSESAPNKPADPSTVFTRRFGDCKDKSLLFVTLLRGLGIDAYPVLVNTQARHMVKTGCRRLASLTIASPWCGWTDRRGGWIRPPATSEVRWPCINLPNYGRGLVISPRTTALQQHSTDERECRLPPSQKILTWVESQASPT